MNLEQAIAHPAINVFDIYTDKKSNYGFSVWTYPKPGETPDEFNSRDNKNFQKALELKRKKQNPVV